uniref:Uncharacterized protein n=1 Tax=Panstrongylus lignarius TaxID=156445 RepID=A0A224XU41_9HEMI
MYSTNLFNWLYFCFFFNNIHLVFSFQIIFFNYTDPLWSFCMNHFISVSRKFTNLLGTLAFLLQIHCDGGWFPREALSTNLVKGRRCCATNPIQRKLRFCITLRFWTYV